MNNELRYTIAGGITLAVLAVMTFMVWSVLQLRPVDRQSTETVSYQVATGTGVGELADGLQEKGLIRSAGAFTMYATLTGKRVDLKAGTYELSPADSAPRIIGKIADGEVSTSRMVVPEGTSLLKLRKIADDSGVPLGDLDTALKDATYANDFLKARPKGATLEGYLYPDSYDINKPVRARALVQHMLDNFATKVAATDIIKRYAAMGLTLHQGVTLASIVEKEVSKPADRVMVAQLYINRLKIGMPLQADPTVTYAAEALNQPFDLKLNSPFNTYVYKGLPPGPICSPGIDAMKAVARPKAHDFLYFISDKQGNNHYAKTFPEHQANIDKYLK